jgi:hypothetical protein
MAIGDAQYNKVSVIDTVAFFLQAHQNSLTRERRLVLKAIGVWSATIDLKPRKTSRESWLGITLHCLIERRVKTEVSGRFFWNLLHRDNLLVGHTCVGLLVHKKQVSRVLMEGSLVQIKGIRHILYILLGGSFASFKLPTQWGPSSTSQVLKYLTDVNFYRDNKVCHLKRYGRTVHSLS